MRHILDQRIRLVLARLEMSQSYAPVQNLNASGSKAKPTGGDKPSGWRAYRDEDELEVPHLRYRKAYDACASNAERVGVCEGAEGTLKALTEVRKVLAKLEPEDPEKRRKRIIGLAGFSVHEVAREIRGTVKEVRAIWISDGREPLFGMRIPETADVETRIVQLSGQGVSIRDIAAQVNVSKSRVQRILRDAA